jgi:hypothetical protein
VLASIARLLDELLAGDQRAVEADERSIEALALDKQG